MATLAQNESKKISQRVKAGQMISFKNGVVYGNGNILGYDRIDGQMVVNREQAEAVKRIFELYLDGNGVQKIQNIMEQEGRTGTPSTRLKKGLSTEGICDNDMFMEWKLLIIVDFMFKKMVSNRNAIYDEAMAMLDDIIEMDNDTEKEKADVERNITLINQYKKQISVLADMVIEGDISKETYRTKRDKLEKQISNLEQKNSEIEQHIMESEDDIKKQKRFENLAEFIKMKAFDPRAKVPEEIVDAFTEKIVFDKGIFYWYLNPRAGNAVYSVDTRNWKKGRQSDLKLVQTSQYSTGCYR